METILGSLRKTMRLAVAHDAHRTLGFGAEIAARCMEEAFDYLDAPVERVACARRADPLHAERHRGGLPRRRRRRRRGRAPRRMTAVIVPQLSISMEEAKVSRWLVEDGDAVAAGQPVVEVETDKATVEIEAPAAGRLRIVARRGRDRGRRRSARGARAGRAGACRSGSDGRRGAAHRRPRMTPSPRASPAASPARRPIRSVASPRLAASPASEGSSSSRCRGRAPAGASSRVTSPPAPRGRPRRSTSRTTACARPSSRTSRRAGSRSRTSTSAASSPRTAWRAPGRRLRRTPA